MRNFMNYKTWFKIVAFIALQIFLTVNLSWAGGELIVSKQQSYDLLSPALQIDSGVFKELCASFFSVDTPHLSSTLVLNQKTQFNGADSELLLEISDAMQAIGYSEEKIYGIKIVYVGDKDHYKVLPDRNPAHIHFGKQKNVVYVANGAHDKDFLIAKAVFIAKRMQDSRNILMSDNEKNISHIERQADEFVKNYFIPIGNTQGVIDAAGNVAEVVNLTLNEQFRWAFEAWELELKAGEQAQKTTLENVNSTPGLLTKFVAFFDKLRHPLKWINEIWTNPSYGLAVKVLTVAFCSVVFVFIIPGMILSFLHLSGTKSPAAEKDPSMLIAGINNDFPYGTDGQYTSRIGFDYLSPITPDSLLSGWRIPFMPELTYKSFGLEQDIYTPTDKKYPDSQKGPQKDRRFAGLLYGNFAVHSNMDDRLDTTALSMGIVGPYSFAEDLQKFVHNANGSYLSNNGWDDQIPTELYAALTYEQRRRLLEGKLFGSSIDYDTIALGGVYLGSHSSSLFAGLQFRLGLNLPHDFGYSLSNPGCHINLESADRFRIWGFAGLVPRVVAYDTFLRGLKREPFIADFNVGIGMEWRKFGLILIHTRRTRQFEGGPSHEFLSLQISYSFGEGKNPSSPVDITNQPKVQENLTKNTDTKVPNILTALLEQKLRERVLGLVYKSMSIENSV